MSEHAWTLEHLEAYAADGLEPAERERLDQHAAACETCAGALAQVLALDASLHALFVSERPGPALEDRMIRALRKGRARRKSRLPMAIRIAIASAAVLLVGIVGAAASQVVLEGELPLPGASRSPAEALADAEQSTSWLLGLKQRALRDPERRFVNTPAEGQVVEVSAGQNLVSRDIDADHFEGKRRLAKEAGEPVSLDDMVDASRRHTLGKLAQYGTNFIPAEGVPPSEVAGIVRKSEVGQRGDNGREKLRDLSQAEVAAAEARREEAKLRWEQSKPLISRGAMSREDSRAAEVTYERYKSEAEAAIKRHNIRFQNGQAPTGSPELGVGGGDARMPAAGPGTGGGWALQTPAPGDSKEGRKDQTADKAPLASYYSYTDNRPAGTTPSSVAVSPDGARLATSSSGGSPGTNVLTITHPPGARGGDVGAGEARATGAFGQTGGGTPAGGRGTTLLGGLSIPAREPGKDGYFRPDDTAAKPAQDASKPEPAKPAEAPPRGDDQGRGKGEGDRDKVKLGGLNQAQGQQGPGPAGGQANQPKPDPTPRKIIIRSGDIEFEVESFDSAVATATKLVNAIPNGFVATVNSEKLPNGKVRGSVVVRVPPEALDGLVLDLRKELGKGGELKGQRIGSQDITKQYTDLESRLRAAKAMETRLLEIIKSGKGEIKDLLLAEKELGVWRTKIEEAEGELRYYSNLVSLSTLTISVYEREIRSPAAITETERVNLGVEVEDVDKSLREAQAAVAEVKGRVTKSEMKQHAAGQFQALLHFEVAPEAAGTLRDRLRQLGTVTRMEIDRDIKTEGGTGRPGEVKSKRADTQFQVSLYNVANIAPRETLQINLAAADAEAAYKAILARIEKAGGRVVTSNLNRQRNDQTQGTVHFEVKTAEAEAVLLDLRSEGEVLHLQVTENPDTQNVTRSKRGFQVQIASLYNASAVAPQTTVQLNLATVDAEEAYKTVLTRIEKAGGRVVSSNLNRQRNEQTQGTIHFEVKSTEADAVLADLRMLGEVMRLQSTDNSGAASVARTKRGFQVQVWALGAVQPRETANLQLATRDVSAGYRALQEAVVKAKGRILNAQLNEQDKQNVTAVLDFEVRRSEEAAVEAVLPKVGTAISRNVTRAADSETVIDTKVRYVLTLSDVNRIPPRETITLAVESERVEKDVATLKGLIGQAQGRVVNSTESQKRTGEVIANVVLDVPLAQAPALVEQVKAFGTIRVHNAVRDTSVPEHALAVARLEVVLQSQPPLVSKEDGLWQQLRKGLSTSANWIILSLSWALVGLLVVLPWALIGYGVVRLVMRLGRREEAVTTG